jgi:probable F420-dependent oxidoreductase
MNIDTPLEADLSTVAALARDAEIAGYDGMFSSENAHDPFLRLAFAATATEHAQLYTSIAVAFARTPMTMAYSAWDVHKLSNGRFSLGLGSQVKPHVERRLSMPWSRPAARMREFAAALRAIWTAWQDGTKLDFRGDFYTHTLMAPMFNPGPSQTGLPKVLIAAVGDRMLHVAAEAGDGLIIHPFATERYIRDVIAPIVDGGLSVSGRDRKEFDLILSAFVVTGTSEEALERAKKATRKQIAFYGSTPAYRAVLELHGWGDLQTKLNALSKEGRWDEMGELVDDEVLNAFAAVGEPDQIAPKLIERFDGVIDRMSFYTPYDIDGNTLSSLAAAVTGRVQRL